MVTNSPLISCIVITANRQAQLAQCLASINRQTYPNTEVIIVDNASSDGTCEFVKNRYPQYCLLCNETNRGVSGGRNDGINLASGKVLVFIDDDAIFESGDAFGEIVRYFEDDQVGVLALKIVNKETGQIQKHEYPVTGWGRREFVRPFEVAYFVGCGFAVRKIVFDEVGLFTEDMMYGPEEVDLSYRIIGAGYRLIYVPNVVVQHMASPVVRRRDVWFYHSMRSRFVLAVRNLPLWALVPYLYVWSVSLGWMAIKPGYLRWYMNGLKDGIKLIPHLLQQRRPISFKVAMTVWRLSGRLFY